MSSISSMAGTGKGYLIRDDVPRVLMYRFDEEMTLAMAAARRPTIRACCFSARLSRTTSILLAKSLSSVGSASKAPLAPRLQS